MAEAVLDGISDKVSGTWSLWRIALLTPESRRQRVLPLFVSDDGRRLHVQQVLAFDDTVDEFKRQIIMKAQNLLATGEISS